MSARHYSLRDACRSPSFDRFPVPWHKNAPCVHSRSHLVISEWPLAALEYNLVPMAVIAGTRFGPYEIEALIGAGGMGEVYRARDTRLQRTVAIKILASHLSSDPVQHARFVQEAKSISGLQHPNICVLHDIGSEAGVDFMVMEYVSGQTLDKMIPPGGMATDLALQYAVQIAEAQIGRA